MPFEIYHPRAKQRKYKPIIVRLSKLSIVLNKVAREQLNTPEFVELAFNKDTNTIRIKSSTIAGGNALKKTKVLAPGFFKQFEISATGTYFAEYNQDENAIYVNLCIKAVCLGNLNSINTIYNGGADCCPAYFFRPVELNVARLPMNYPVFFDCDFRTTESNPRHFT